MITPDEIIKKAKRKYRDVLRAWLSGESLFPMEFPVGRLSKDMAQRRAQIDLLRQHSKEESGQGYTLEWKTSNRRDLGRQTTPRRVVVETLDDYLSLVRRRTEFNNFVADVEKIRGGFPALDEWLYANPQSVIDHSGKWDDLLLVCNYFVQRSCPNVYIRELPIPVHTKFIEQNPRILRDLLDILLPAESIETDETDFARRYGLRDKPALIRLRLLEEQLDWQYGLRLDDLTLPVGQAAHLLASHIKPGYVIIVENLINFLTLPAHPNSVGLFGQGFAIHLLGQVDWLHHCNIIYWGDIDASGLQILSDLRQIFPHVRSVMMNRQTLDEYAAYIVTDNTNCVDRFDGLTEAEIELAQYIHTHHMRLEQEHIPHDYAIAQLKYALLSNKYN